MSWLKAFLLDLALLALLGLSAFILHTCRDTGPLLFFLACLVANFLTVTARLLPHLTPEDLGEPGTGLNAK
jgi:hypothetical protein